MSDQRAILEQLSEAVKRYNSAGAEITAIIGRPAQAGHFGEFIASLIFEIALVESASHPGIDGYFTNGSLAGKSVNVKFSTKRDGLLNLNDVYSPDYYLVISGPKIPSGSSRGQSRPWCVASVHLFSHLDLRAELLQRGVGIGIASSVSRSSWESAEVYPNAVQPLLTLSVDQVNLLRLFAPPTG